jgi:hypothetical protein
VRKGLVANLHSQIRSLRTRKGLQRKARRICMGKSEDLERKARFAAFYAANAPEDGCFPI